MNEEALSRFDFYPDSSVLFLIWAPALLLPKRTEDRTTGCLSHMHVSLCIFTGRRDLVSKSCSDELQPMRSLALLAWGFKSWELDACRNVRWCLLMLMTK